MIISKVGQLYLKYVFHILVFVLNGYNLNLNRDYRIRKTYKLITSHEIIKVDIPINNKHSFSFHFLDALTSKLSWYDIVK